MKAGIATAETYNPNQLPPPGSIEQVEQAEFATVISITGILAARAKTIEERVPTIPDKLNAGGLSVSHVPGIGEAMSRERPTAKNRVLKKMADKQGASQLPALDKLNEALDDLNFPILNHAEVTTALEFLEGRWKYVPSHEGKPNLLLRSYPEAISFEGVEAMAIPGKRAATLHGSTLVIGTAPSRGVWAEDIGLLIDLERAYKAPLIDREAQLAVAKLTNQHKRVLSLMYMEDKRIAAELGTTTATVRTHHINIRKRLGLKDSSEEVVFAIRSDRLSLEDVPKPLNTNLKGRPLEILKGYHDKTYQEAAQDLGLSFATVRYHWHTVFETLGASNKRQAFVVAIKGGIIPLESLVAKMSAAETA